MSVLFEPDWKSNPISAIKFYNFLVRLSNRNHHVFLILFHAPREAVIVEIEDSHGKKMELTIPEFFSLMKRGKLHPTRMFVTVRYRIYMLRKDWGSRYRNDEFFTGTECIQCDRLGDLAEIEEGYIGILVYWIRSALFAKKPFILDTEQGDKWRFSPQDEQMLQTAFVMYSRAILDEIGAERRRLGEIEEAAGELIEMLADMPFEEEEEEDDYL